MSSTNRGYDRHKADYYVTPQKYIREFLTRFIRNEDITNPSRLEWLDPCAGGDDNNQAAYVSVIEKDYSPSLVSMDIREDSHAKVIGDFLELGGGLNTQFDIVISNPPFYLAEEFIRQSLEACKDGGYVIMLLRLNFFGSDKRKNLFDTFMPNSCYVHRNRINFIPDSMKQQMKEDGLKPPSGDSIEYAHFVWKKGENPEFCKTYIL